MYPKRNFSILWTLIKKYITHYTRLYLKLVVVTKQARSNLIFCWSKHFINPHSYNQWKFALCGRDFFPMTGVRKSQVILTFVFLARYSLVDPAKLFYLLLKRDSIGVITFLK